MEYTGGGGGGAVLSGGNVPAFLTKLWTLVEDPDTDPLICWSPGGTSFHVFDQGRFSKEVLPKFFKHNNMASFIRQLNMYGFRKVIHIEQGGLLKPEKDDTEFHHPFFLRGQEHLLENIKRKVTNVSAVQEVKANSHDVNKILTDVQLMKGKQENIDSRISAMKHENEALWREVASLRQKHVQQQKVVNKLIHFLVSLVQSNRVLGVKRKLPLMLNDSSSSHSMPKYSRPLSLEHIQAAASLFSADSPASVTSGPIISDVTDVATPTADCVVYDWTDAGDGLAVNIKEEPSNPDAEACPVLEGGGGTPTGTPFSPTTFINSILEEKASPLTPPNTSSPTPGPGPSSQVVSSSDSDPDPTKPQQSCQTVACIDRSELSSHVDSIDSGLENLQGYLNTQTFAFDTSPLMEFFSSSPCPSGDFDLDSLDTLLADDVSNGGAESSSLNTGKQLVQYTPTPLLASEPISSGVMDLPSLLEAESFSSSAPPTDDPAVASISHHLDSDL